MSKPVIDALIELMHDIEDNKKSHTIWFSDRTTMFEHISHKVIIMGARDRLEKEFPEYF